MPQSNVDSIDGACRTIVQAIEQHHGVLLEGERLVSFLLSMATRTLCRDMNDSSTELLVYSEFMDVLARVKDGGFDHEPSPPTLKRSLALENSPGKRRAVDTQFEQDGLDRLLLSDYDMYGVDAPNLETQSEVASTDFASTASTATTTDSLRSSTTDWCRDVVPDLFSLHPDSLDAPPASASWFFTPPAAAPLRPGPPEVTPLTVLSRDEAAAASRQSSRTARRRHCFDKPASSVQ